MQKHYKGLKKGMLAFSFLFVVSVSAQDTNVEKIEPEIINEELEIHIVEAGETLYSISRLEGISIPHIMAVNNLKSNKLRVGQKLKMGYYEKAKVFINDTTKGFWIVKKGDTLFKIAKEANVSITKIKTLNNLTSNVISVGDKLILD